MAWAKYLTRGVLVLLVYFTLVALSYTGSRILVHGEREDFEPLKSGKWENMWEERFIKEDLSVLFREVDLLHAPERESYLEGLEGQGLAVETSLDPDLQKYILRLLQRSQTLQAAVVVLSPKTGRIMAMADYQNSGKESRANLCLKADYPAASLFKIVSAAAAIEARGFRAGQPVYFRGMRHTLYNSQLKQGTGRYTRRTSFKRAFSASINPVFGKMGIYDLGRRLMTEYAERFLFNQEIPFDLPLAISTIQIPEDNYGLAEIASGFNKRTLISPLHVSLITAAVANSGLMTEPWLVKRVRDESGKVLYRARLTRLGSPIEESTARELRVLMEDTVAHGTSRKAFRPLQRNKFFQDIALGAKTGTINDRQDRYKYDWLTAYALPKKGDNGICLTALAVHGKKLGIRASELARYIIHYYFTS